MKHITVDDETYALAERWAARRGMTVSDAVADALRIAEPAPDAANGGTEAVPKMNPMDTLGCMADEADVLDQIVEEAMRDRATRPLRTYEIDLGLDDE
jgi:hypothetical protein